MADGNAFAEEFLALLKRSKFPKGVSVKNALRQQHAIVTALSNRVAGLIVDENHNDMISQGGVKGGGGPHRQDLLLHFSADTDRDTFKNTNSLIKAAGL